MKRLITGLVAGALLALAADAQAQPRNGPPAPPNVRKPAPPNVRQKSVTFENDTGDAVEVWLLSEQADAQARAFRAQPTRSDYVILDVQRGIKHQFFYSPTGNKYYVALVNPRTGVENHLGWIDLNDLVRRAGGDAVMVGLKTVRRTKTVLDENDRPVQVQEALTLPDLILCKQGRLTYYLGNRFDFRQGKPTR